MTVQKSHSQPLKSDSHDSISATAPEVRASFPDKEEPAYNQAKTLSHDPSCPWVRESWWDNSCVVCDLIARVRKDQRARTLEEAIGIITDMREDHIRWYRVALQDAAEALYELRHTAPPVDTTQ